MILKPSLKNYLVVSFIFIFLVISIYDSSIAKHLYSTPEKDKKSVSEILNLEVVEATKTIDGQVISTKFIFSSSGVVGVPKFQFPKSDCFFVMIKLNLVNNLEKKVTFEIRELKAISKKGEEQTLLYLATFNDGQKSYSNKNYTSVVEANSKEQIELLIITKKMSELLTLQYLDENSVTLDLSSLKTTKKWKKISVPGKKKSVNNVFVLTEDNTLRIYDVTNPSHSKLVNIIKFNKNVSDISAIDNQTLIVSYEFGVDIYDIKNLQKIVVIAHIKTGGKPGQAVVFKKYLYITDMEKGLLVVDFNNPNQPKTLEVFREEQEPVWHWDFRPIIDNNEITAKFENMTFFGNKIEFFEKGLLLYGKNMAVKMIFLEDPTKPKILSSFQPIDLLRGLISRGNILITVDRSRSVYILRKVPKKCFLVVYNIDYPNSPLPIGALKVSGAMKAVDIKDNIVYIGASEAGFHAVDIHDPKNPKLVKTISTGGSIVDLKVVGNLLYMVNNEKGLLVFSIKDPNNPRQIGRSKKKFKGKILTLPVR